MKKVCTLVLSLFSVIITLIGIVLFLEQRQPITSQLAILHLTDCSLPCWIGVVPGHTSVDIALENIKSTYGIYPIHYSVTNYNSFIIDIGYNTPYLLSIILSTDNRSNVKIVDDILLVNSSTLGKVTFGDVISLLSNPDRIEPSPINSNVNPSIIYKNSRMRIGFGTSPDFISTCGQISMDQEISGIGFGVSTDLKSANQEWKGFRCYY